MADPRGFLAVPRRGAVRRPVALRVRDWREVYEPVLPEETQAQASRCMDCGVPFCHHACPLGNLIPEWNDLVWRGRWRDAWERLEATNNFPDFTGRLCPAPCEAACVVGIADQPVSIELVEKEVAERAEAEGFVRPRPPARSTGRRVAVVGSGPAGLAAAQQLARAGHAVSVYERAERPGGLLRYGIPEFKLEKAVLDRRLAQLLAEGVIFHTGVEPGVDLRADELLDDVDALVLAIGATQPRDLPIPGRELPGILQAMAYLPAANRAVAGGDPADLPPGYSAEGRRVVIIGGGDTGADCLGTAHRQGAISVAQLEIMPQPPGERAPSTPWPLWPLQLRTSAAHEEGGERRFSVSTQRFLAGADGRVAGLVLAEVEPVHDGGALRFAVVPGTEETLPCELVLLALGFTGPERAPLLDQLGLALDEAGRLACGPGFSTSSAPVFCCGDARRGQSLVVWAIAEGRSCAAAVDAYLQGETALPSPLRFEPSLATRAG